MEQGLAQQMVYGDGKDQNTKHYYAGVMKKKKRGCGCGTPHTPRKKTSCGCKKSCSK